MLRFRPVYIINPVFIIRPPSLYFYTVPLEPAVQYHIHVVYTPPPNNVPRETPLFI